MKSLPINISHNELSKVVAKWLKKHPQNAIVPNCSKVAVNMKTIEQEIPDVIGWNSWSSIMIEVKVNRSDFLQDFKKPFRIDPRKGVGQYRYYCCPPEIISVNDLPDKYGLLYLNEKGDIDIIKVAEIQESNLKAERNMLLSLLNRNNY